MKVQYQINGGPQINAPSRINVGGVYLKFDPVDAAFIRGAAFDREIRERHFKKFVVAAEAYPCSKLMYNPKCSVISF